MQQVSEVQKKLNLTDYEIQDLLLEEIAKNDFDKIILDTNIICSSIFDKIDDFASKLINKGLEKEDIKPFKEYVSFLEKLFAYKEKIYITEGVKKELKEIYQVLIRKKRNLKNINKNLHKKFKFGIISYSLKNSSSYLKSFKEIMKKICSNVQNFEERIEVLVEDSMPIYFYEFYDFLKKNINNDEIVENDYKIVTWAMFLKDIGLNVAIASYDKHITALTQLAKKKKFRIPLFNKKYLSNKYLEKILRKGVIYS